MDLARNLKIDSVSRLRPTSPLTVPPSCTLSDAVLLMRQRRAGCLLVCEAKKLLGVFTEHDLMARVLAPGVPLTDTIESVMTPDPVTVYCKDPIRVAAQKMLKGGHRHLPVLDEAERPVGVISVIRIVHYLVEHFPAIVHNLPPDSTPYPLQREGA